MEEILDELFKNINVEGVLGKKGELSNTFKLLIDNEIISKKEALDIQGQLIDEYDVGKTTRDGFVKRLLFLANNTDIDFTNIQKFSRYMKDENSCPYCGMDIQKDDTTCQTCGYNLEYEDDEDNQILSEEEAYDILRKILIDMSEVDSESSDELFYLANAPLYYQGKEGNIRSTDVENAYDPDDEDLDYDIDEDGEFCFRLDNSHNCQYDNYDLCLYSIIEYVYEGCDNLVNEVEDSCDLYERDDTDKFLKDVVDKGYVTKYLDPVYWDELAKTLKKTDLQDILRRYDLKVSGNKKQLSERIKDNINLEEIELNSIPSYDDADYTIYFATKKGEEFLESHKYIKIYDLNLYDYHYDEYKKYIKDYKDDDYYNASHDFLELHVQNALNRENQDNYIDHLNNQVRIWHNKDNKRYFKALIRLFIACLNPIDTDEIFFYNDNLIDMNTLEKIRKECDENDYDIEGEIVKQYSNITHVTVPLNVLIENLPTLLSKDNHEKLDEKWRKKYLKHNLADLC